MVALISRVRRHFLALLRPIWVPLVLLPFFVAFNVKADEVTSAVLSPQAISTGIAGYLSQIESLEYTISQGLPDGASFSKLRWLEKGYKYRYDIFLKSENKRDFSSSITYDGESAYWFEKGGDRLVIQRLPFEHLDSFLKGARSPLLPFEFLTGKNQRISIESLIRNCTSEEFIERLTIQSQKTQLWHGKQCYSVKIVNSYSRFQNGVVDYIVYFCPEFGFFPVGWESFSKDGEHLLSFYVSEYQDVEMKKGVEKKIRVPLSAVLRNNEIMHDYSLPAADETLTFTDVKINSVDDSEFTPDPLNVSYIEDRDANVLIEIPK